MASNIKIIAACCENALAEADKIAATVAADKSAATVAANANFTDDGSSLDTRIPYWKHELDAKNAKETSDALKHIKKQNRIMRLQDSDVFSRFGRFHFFNINRCSMLAAKVANLNRFIENYDGVIDSKALGLISKTAAAKRDQRAAEVDAEESIKYATSAFQHSCDAYKHVTAIEAKIKAMHAMGKYLVKLAPDAKTKAP